MSEFFGCWDVGVLGCCYAGGWSVGMLRILGVGMLGCWEMLMFGCWDVKVFIDSCMLTYLKVAASCFGQT